MRLECSAGGSGAPQPQQKHTETLGRRSSLELSTAVVLVCMVAGGGCRDGRAVNSSIAHQCSWWVRNWTATLRMLFNFANLLKLSDRTQSITEDNRICQTNPYLSIVLKYSMNESSILASIFISASTGTSVPEPDTRQSTARIYQLWWSIQAVNELSPAPATQLLALEHGVLNVQA